jgi:indole-3-glycerol phosphate synthase
MDRPNRGAVAPDEVRAVSRFEAIIESARRRVADVGNAADLDQRAREASPPRDFLGAIKASGTSLIAEVKKRSPSAGDLNATASAAELVAAYEKGGARGLSVLTEPEFFLGSAADLEAAREATALPALRKDFLLDPVQIIESRAMGADAVLVIVKAVPDDALLDELLKAAGELSMTALVEIHDERELDRAMDRGSELIGINQRDLTTFEVDTKLAARLRPSVPEGVVVVAESGIATRDDVAALEDAGVDAILVGEALMRSEDPARSIRQLLGQ